MAEKMAFFTNSENWFEEKIITYTYYPGFAVSQKQRSVESLHESIRALYPDKRILEVSTKSLTPLGMQLSAFNLPFYHEELQAERRLENVFQSSKVFSGGGPYRDLLNVSPKDAKRDERLRSSGELIGFQLYGDMWPLEPKTIFYDWIYITALKAHEDIAKQLLEYDVFTDIEFNHKKSINCQARTVAIFVSLCRAGKLESKTSDMETFKTIYNGETKEIEEQISMF